MKTIHRWLITLGSLFVISIILTFFKITFLESLRIVFGSFYVLFVPGYFITHLIFSKKLNKKENIDFIERLTLSFAFSIAIVPLTIFYLNKIGIKINALNSFLSILGIIVVTILLIVVLRKKKN